MKKNLAFILFISIALMGCKKDSITGEGPVISEIRDVNNFNKVSTGGATRVRILKGNNFRVEVQGHANLLPYLETKVVNHELQIAFRDRSSVRNDNTEVWITMPALTGVATEGSGPITATGDFSGNAHFSARTSGSGSIFIEKGSAATFTGQIYGSGDIRATGVVTTEATITIEGSGNAQITAEEKLNAVISGSGNVYYRGTPVIQSQIRGSGRVLPQ